MSARAGCFAFAICILVSCAAPAYASPADSLTFDSWGRVGAGVITPPGAPRLVVVLLFDQFRADFLDRFRSDFGPDGFLRLEREGTDFTDCTITCFGVPHRKATGDAPESTRAFLNSG